MTADFVYDFYSRDGSYMHLYEKVMDPHPRQNLYRLFAFSQHYLDVSPFVDFTKSLYVSLSFALKNRQVYPAPLALYTVKIRDEGDYTESLATANAWLEDYKVYVFRRREDYIKSLMQSGAARAAPNAAANGAGASGYGFNGQCAQRQADRYSNQ